MSEAAIHQASVQDSLFEDSQTFWSRSNARLGMDAAYFGKDGDKNGKTRPPVEFPCAVCGEWVMLERWPKDRHEVRCESCKAAVGGLLVGEERSIAQDFRKQRKAELKGRYEGLPDMSPEDLEAIREMREVANAMGNGRVGNRRGKVSGASGGGGGKQRRRKKGDGGGGGGGGGDQPRRQKSGRGGKGGGGGGGRSSGGRERGGRRGG